MRKSHLLVGIAVLTGALLAGTPAVAVPPATGDAVSVPVRYPQQKINWKPCFPGGPPTGLPAGSARLECGSFSAPRNWHRPDDKIDVTIAVSRLRPSGAARGSVVTNPGGPGGPGRILPLAFLGRPKLLAGQEIVGMDPRGTGQSSNVTCGGQAMLGSDLDPRDRDAANIDLILKSNRLVAQNCQTRSGELGRYVTTEQTVRDIDLLRALLGREKINFIGYSGGTWLGAHYATAFPNRVGAFVLDSAVDFTGTFEDAFNAQPQAFERRWREDFLTWAARYDATYRLGASGDAARRTYERIRATLVEKPLVVEGRELTAVLFDTAIASALYSKKHFTDLAEFLVGVRKLTEAPAGAARDRAAVAEVAGYRARLAAWGPLPMAPFGHQDAPEATFLAITCNDTPWQGTESSLVRLSERLGRQYPLVGWSVLAQPCISWRRPNVTLPAPTGAGAPPLLIVQSTHDPATPIEGALRAHRAFVGSRMLTVTGEGDHGIYALTRNGCVDYVVERFLVDGRVPAQDVACPGIPLPSPAAAAHQAPTGLAQVSEYRRIAGPLPR